MTASRPRRSAAPNAIPPLQRLVEELEHDMRNPVGNILGYIDLLRDQVGTALSEEHRLFLNRIEQNCTVLLEVVEHFAAAADALNQGNTPDTDG